MNNYVAFHSEEIWGHPFGDWEPGVVFDQGDVLGFVTQKNYKTQTLHHQRIWLITKPKSGEYWLLGTGLVVEEPVRTKSGELEFDFVHDAPFAPLRVDQSKWFKDLYVEQNQFSMGVRIIQDKGVLQALNGLLAHKPAEDAKGTAEPMSLKDARQRRAAMVVARQGQTAFRKDVLTAYGNRCAISDCDAIAALEAAHVIPYLGPDTNRVENSLLLRADLHLLFDQYLIAIDTKTWTVCLHPSLEGTSYASLAGTKVRQAPKARALKGKLDKHREACDF